MLQTSQRFLFAPFAPAGFFRNPAYRFPKSWTRSNSVCCIIKMLLAVYRIRLCGDGKRSCARRRNASSSDPAARPRRAEAGSRGPCFTNLVFTVALSPRRRDAASFDSGPLFSAVGLLIRGIPPKRAHTPVAVVRVVPVHRAGGIDVADVVRIRRYKPHPKKNAPAITAAAHFPLLDSVNRSRSFFLRLPSQCFIIGPRRAPVAGRKLVPVGLASPILCLPSRCHRGGGMRLPLIVVLCFQPLAYSFAVFHQSGRTPLVAVVRVVPVHRAGGIDVADVVRVRRYKPHPEEKTPWRSPPRRISPLSGFCEPFEVLFSNWPSSVLLPRRTLSTPRIAPLKSGSFCSASSIKTACLYNVKGPVSVHTAVPGTLPRPERQVRSRPEYESRFPAQRSSNQPQFSCAASKAAGGGHVVGVKG